MKLGILEDTQGPGPCEQEKSWRAAGANPQSSLDAAMGSRHFLLQAIHFSCSPGLNEINIPETCPGNRLFSGRLQLVTCSKRGEFLKQLLLVTYKEIYGNIQRYPEQDFKPLLLNVTISFLPPPPFFFFA